ncbi:Putative cell cycle checkpoint protein RAD1 [Gryllus bimaculatus]|nr:Putative cell cycle checkpoint protein RAD1 [Gryllus bimaculatus]
MLKYLLKMSLLHQPEHVDEDNVLVATLDSVKVLLQLLKAINFRECGIIFATEKGLKVTVEDSKSIQASAFISEDVFETYTLNAEEVVFKINLNVLKECLNSMSSSNYIALKISYKGYGDSLRLIMSQGSSITGCSIKTMEPEQMLDFHTGTLNIINKVMLRSEYLKEVFNELDPMAEYVEFILSPNTPYFRLSTHSIGGDCRVDIPKDCDMIESFQCTSLTAAKYKLSHIKPSCKPLSLSQKVSISTDERGLLCFQYMIRIENYNGYIEYYCTPIVDSYDD